MFDKPGLSRGGFVEHRGLTKVAQQSVTKIISLAIMNLVTPKAAPKHEVLFKKPAFIVYSSEAGSLNNRSCLAATLGVTKFTIVTDMILVTLCCAT
jgi:hypothetical protein